MNEYHLVQSWSYKKNNSYDNDDVEILGIYQNLGNAKDFVNNRFTFFLIERHRQICDLLFPQVSRKEIVTKCLRQHFDQLVTGMILSYLYQDPRNMINAGADLPEKEYHEQIINLPLTLDHCYHQLMKLQNWVSNHTSSAFFPEYCTVKLIINGEISCTLKRMSSETCRLKIKDHQGKSIDQSFYLGYNLIDLEDCSYRERHFCSSFRIHTKNLRD